MDKFLFIVISVDGSVFRHWGTNLDVKKGMSDEKSAVVIRGNQEAMLHESYILWEDIADGNVPS